MTRSTNQTTGTAADGPLLRPSGDVHAVHRVEPDTAQAHDSPEAESHPEDDPEVRQGMEMQSPDGAPPDPQERRAGMKVLYVVVIACVILLMVPLFIIGGPLAVVIGGAIAVGFFLLAQAPAWVAGLNRKQDRDYIAKQIGHHRTDSKGSSREAR